jgi:UDPglucose 6-dehydrogenase
MARIGIFGAGYVGLVTGTCFAALGNDVVVRDVVPEKIDALRRGDVPIFEPGLRELLEQHADRMTFTTDIAEAIEDADFLYIAVGTPPTHSGDADLSAVWTVIEELPSVSGSPVVVMKSTVPVGTGEKVRAALDARGLQHVGYVSNPEFLAEGTALRDFMNPDRIVIGAFAGDDGDRVEELHRALDAQVVRCDVASAEMVKLAANAFLSTRISFINEIANVCELVGADVEAVAKGVGLDHRLGPHFLRAGIGFGGSCLTGDETALVRRAGEVSLVSLAQLYAGVEEAEPVDVLAWLPEAATAEFLPVTAVTRREVNGEILELRTKMGRRVRCTDDHPFVTRDGVKLARDLTTDDWLPLARLDEEPSAETRTFHLLDGLDAAGLSAEDVIVRPAPLALEAAGARSLQSALSVARSHDVVRAGALRLDELLELGLPLERSMLKTTRNGTSVPVELEADEAFWRVVGLYIAEGHVTQDGERRRLQWSFHPRDEAELVEEVYRFWVERGVRADVQHRATTMCVVVSSRLLGGFWLGPLGLGRNAYEHRLPDAIWTASAEHKRALLAGLWLGDGSWSYVNGGPSVILEYGTVSRELADGMLRLLADLGIVTSLRVGRTAKSTVDTYWLRISGADQVEHVLDFVPAPDRAAIVSSLARQAKRIAPTGYRRGSAPGTWVRVASVDRKPFAGAVYSLEVPGAHTFVTTGGLVTHNCFPKDVSALKQLAGNSGYHFQLLSAVIEVNELQKRRVIAKLQKHLGSLRGKTVALLGLAFKPNTDDLREAPSLVIAARLIAEGAAVRTWDPVADASEFPGVTACDSVLEAVTGADAAVIVTEWPELAGLASEEVRDVMARPVIVDGRNLLDPAAVRAAGFAYEGIGRPSSPFETLPETPEPKLNF